MKTTNYLLFAPVNAERLLYCSSYGRTLGMEAQDGHVAAAQRQDFIAPLLR